ncbi:phosphate ABC transporter permease PstA [candidate division WOR-3 bacterium]|nr:phosphate ABC transporter permease PstA [candidate division WOR-3 bacterium]MCK4755801.1 phosphate ABC transporter permease PstA [candidate division WOR-3 bacterium]NOR18433.1 phosphate ABC transporter permease PstA [candidate division WOR-3 bacterium]
MTFRIGPRTNQIIAYSILLLMTLITVVVLFFIIGYVFKNGIGQLSLEFLTDKTRDMGKEGGILPSILGTFFVTIFAIIIATPLGVGSAVYLVEYTKGGLIHRIISFGADCLAGVPSIIFGLFGFIFFVIRLNLGWSIISGGLTLAVMIIPTIIRTTEEAIKAVPHSFREISYSLGGGKLDTILKVVLPTSLPGILTGVILGIGRAVGETAAVIFTAGSSLGIPTSAFSSTRTLAVHFYILAREGISMPKAYATATVLIIIILLVNFIAYRLMHRFMAKYY